MAKYRRKPELLDAWQYDPAKRIPGVKEAKHNPGFGEVDTIKGPSIVHPGDWVIRNARGDYHVCSVSVFESLYELVEDSK